MLFAMGQPLAAGMRCVRGVSRAAVYCVVRAGAARALRAGAARALELKKTQIWLVSYELLA